MAVTPRSLILDLMATLPPEGSHSMPVRALVEAGACFGLVGNSVRVALARLLAQGGVERDERGRYRPGAAVASSTRAIRGWRRLESRTRTWSGAWVAVQNPGSRRRRQRVQDEQALRLFGFQAWDSSLSLRPDNLLGGLEGLRPSLFGAGLASHALVACMRDLAEDQETRARALWDVNRLEAEYRETTLALSQSRRRLSRSSTEEAMVETFRVGGQAIRQLVLDPLLPQEMVDSHERSTLVKAMMEYDKFGRAFWAPFMQRHGVVRRGASAALPFETAAGIYPDVSQEAGAI